MLGAERPWVRVAARHLLTLGTFAALSGCASAQITSAWKVPTNHQPPPKRVLVVGRIPQERWRRFLERELVAKLHALGCEAAASSLFLGRSRQMTEEELRVAMRRDGFDAVLVARYLGTERRTRYLSAGFGVGTSGGDYQLTRASGRWIASERVRMEAVLLDANRQGALIWSLTTESQDAESTLLAIPGFLDVVVERLRSDVLG